MWIGGIAAPLRKLPKDVDAIVSLCRVTDVHLPAGVQHLDVRLIDREGQNENPNLDFVLLDTVRAIRQLRDEDREDRTVVVHCVQAASRTPTIAALYGARKQRIDIDDALRERGRGAAGRRPEHRIPRGAATPASHTPGVHCDPGLSCTTRSTRYGRKGARTPPLRAGRMDTGRPTRAGVNAASNWRRLAGRSSR